MRWYLAGPICHVKDDSNRTWRELAKNLLDCLDPFDANILINGKSPKEYYNQLQPLQYAPHNVDWINQAYCLLSIWLHWYNRVIYLLKEG